MRRILPLVILLIASAAGADFVSVTTSAEANRYRYGTNAPTLTANDGDIGYDTRAPVISDLIAKFSINPGQSITSAILMLTVVGSNTSIYPSPTESFSLSGGSTAAVAVTLADFDKFATSLGTYTVPAGIGLPGVPSATLSIDVTSLVATALAGGSSTVGFQAVKTNPGGITFGIASDPAAVRPYLNVVYSNAVPEPGSMLLLGLGLAGVGLRYMSARTYRAGRDSDLI